MYVVFLILWHLYLNYLFSRILLRIKISSKSKNCIVFLTCAARSDCDIEPPFEFPKPPSPADWSGDPIRGGVDSFLRGTGLIGSLKNRVNSCKILDFESKPWIYIASRVVSDSSDSVHEIWNCLTSLSWIKNKQLLDY